MFNLKKIKTNQFLVFTEDMSYKRLLNRLAEQFGTKKKKKIFEKVLYAFGSLNFSQHNYTDL